MHIVESIAHVWPCVCSPLHKELERPVCPAFPFLQRQVVDEDMAVKHDRQTLVIHPNLQLLPAIRCKAGRKERRSHLLVALRQHPQLRAFHRHPHLEGCTSPGGRLAIR